MSGQVGEVEGEAGKSYSKSRTRVLARSRNPLRPLRKAPPLHRAP
jgi:hypothetical protein